VSSEDDGGDSDDSNGGGGVISEAPANVVSLPKQIWEPI
jgi:hypothetical protein